jgi:hypothetical protein
LDGAEGHSLFYLDALQVALRKDFADGSFLESPWHLESRDLPQSCDELVAANRALAKLQRTHAYTSKSSWGLFALPCDNQQTTDPNSDITCHYILLHPNYF